MDNTLIQHSKRIGMLEQDRARHDERIRDLEERHMEYKDMFKRINDKLDRPSWLVTLTITGLFSMVTGLIVYITTI